MLMRFAWVSSAYTQTRCGLCGGYHDYKKLRGSIRWVLAHREKSRCGSRVLSHPRDSGDHSADELGSSTVEQVRKY